MPAPVVPEHLVLAPFRALRYDATRIGDLAAVVSPPYDVIDEAGVERLEAADPHNVVRLILPRGPETGPDSRYVRAAELLRAWRAEQVLVPDATPSLYVYEESEGEHIQRGLVGGLGLVPFEAGIVLPHENVMPGPVADRLALMTATEANLEPIFCVYEGGGSAGNAATEVVTQVAEQPPLVDIKTDDGVGHRIWAITDREALEAVARDLAGRTAVIADGHHRYTTYLHLQAERYAAGHDRGPWDQGLTLLADTTTFGPQVHAIHRYIRGLSAADAAQRAEATFAVRRVDGDVDALMAELAGAGSEGGAFALADETDRYLVTEPDPALVDRVLPADRSAAWLRLDVTIAHHVLIREVWGLADTVEQVGYAHDVDEAVALARGANGTALLLNPTPVDAVAAVARAGDRMPRKSTLFTPKPRTGLLIRAFADG